MLTHAVVLLVASMAFGQAEARRPTDDFTKLRGFLGTWEARGVENQGRETESPVSWKPILDGQFIMTKTADGFEYRATGSLPDDKKTSYYGIWKKRQ